MTSGTSSGTTPPAPSREEVSRFCDGALEGNKTLILEYLDKYGEGCVDLGNPSGSSALCLAAWMGHKDIVDLLLQYGADIEKKGLFGRRPLMFAAWNGHGDVAQLLLEKGASVDGVDDDGVIAAVIARHYLQFNTATLIEGWEPSHPAPVLEKKGRIKRGDDVLHTTVTGSPSQQDVDAFCAAAEDGNNAAIGNFLQRWGNAHIDRRGNNENAALLRAAWRGRKEAVALLLKSGADINQKGFMNRAALTFAILSKDKDTVQFLLERGASIQKADVGQGWSVKKWAGWSERADIIDLIAEWSEKQVRQREQKILDDLASVRTEAHLQKLRQMCPVKRTFKRGL